MSEWDCASSSNSGTFHRSSDCVISGGAHVEVSGKLEIVGSIQNMENLVTITAATKCRHFSLNGADKTLVLRFVKLVGGDVRAADLNQDAGSRKR